MHLTNLLTMIQHVSIISDWAHYFSHDQTFSGIQNLKKLLQIFYKATTYKVVKFVILPVYVWQYVLLGSVCFTNITAIAWEICPIWVNIFCYIL